MNWPEGWTHLPGRPVTTQTLYQIRSTTKALAAIAMLMLYEKHHFAFEDPVAKHWPEFVNQGQTIHYHCSGYEP